MSLSNDSALLFQLASNHKGDLPGLLRSFFGFLHQNTDLYVQVDDPAQANMGFKPGDAEKQVLNAFRSYPYNSHQPRSLQSKSEAAVKSTSSSSSPASTSSAIKTNASGTSSKPAPSTLPSSTSTKKGLLTPVDNGANLDGSSWTQTLRELFVVIKVPSGTRGKDVSSQITKEGLDISLKQSPSNVAKLLQGNFPPGEGVVVDDCYWGVEGTSLTLTLAKKRDSWWPCVVQGQPMIDTSLVDSSRRISDYDSQTQSAIEKAMVEQQGKLGPKP